MIKKTIFEGRYFGARIMNQKDDQRGNKEGRKEVQYIYLQFIFSRSSLGNGNEDISSEKAFRKVENQEILIYY